MDAAPRAHRLDLAPEPASVPAARAFVTSALAASGLADLADAAALLTSELATNAVQHAGTPYAVVVRPNHDGAVVDVLDHSPGRAAPTPPGVLTDNGRGLYLVEGLAVDWGGTPEEACEGFAKGVRFAVSRTMKRSLTAGW